LPRLLLCYHFFHPDDVVSARQFDELAQEQRRRGWDVTVLTSNRSWDRSRTFAPDEDWEGVRIRRVFRPDWAQSRPAQRLANSAWMLGAWFAGALRLGRFDAIVIGSDPAFAALLAAPLRAASPSTAIVHWCFDLYPEAILAERGEASGGPLAAAAAVARAAMGVAYRCCDALVDIGPGMRDRLAAYPTPAERHTLVPWALVAPGQVAATDGATRARMFPRAKLALLYSGTLGRAHDFRRFLELARACRARSGDAISFCFSSRGFRQEQLRDALTADDTNVTLAPFAQESELLTHLGAADLHLLSVQPEWAGVVVPSKFFGSLAVGRPVVFSGPARSEIARWIDEHDVGLSLPPDDLGAAVERLHALADDPRALARWQARALETYEREFSKRVVNDRWDALLRDLITRRTALQD
jgi:colanic acid biosynthesis glycosyl transferase WcaI